MARHFAYRAAAEVLKRFPDQEVYVVEAGVTPSGKIHLGNFNDVVISDAVLKALKKMGHEARGYLVIDSRDPFRQPPSFAPEEFRKEAEQYRGRPFEELPDPWGCHSSYAEHFVEPVEQCFEDYGVELKVKWASEIHGDPRFAELLARVIAERNRVREIFNEVRRRAGHEKLYPEGWIPYRPKCRGCGRIDEVVEPLEVVDKYRVRYRCSACGYEGVADIRKAEGKPPWRVDWPLRWMLLNVHFEPLGKDHMASGSGYEMGCELVRKLFGREPPIPVFYDFVYLVERRGEKREYKKFSKRKGIGLGADEWLRYAPPEALRYAILKREVRDIFSEALSHWEFDFSLIPQYVQEFDKFEQDYFDAIEGRVGGVEGEYLREAYGLVVVSIPPRRPRRIPYWQLVRVAAWMTDLDDGMKMLERQGKLRGLEDWELKDARRRLEMAWNWIREVGLSAVLPSPGEALERLKELSAEEKTAFAELARGVASGAINAENVGESVKRIAEKLGLTGRKGRLTVYRAAYKVLLGEESGPPLRRLLIKKEVIELLREIVEGLEA